MAVNIIIGAADASKEKKSDGTVKFTQGRKGHQCQRRDEREKWREKKRDYIYSLLATLHICCPLAG